MTCVGEFMNYARSSRLVTVDVMQNDQKRVFLFLQVNAMIGLIKITHGKFSRL